MMVVMNDEILYNLADRIYQMGKTSGQIEAGAKPKYISQNKADKQYGRAAVREWIKSGLVRRYKDSPLRNAKVRLDVLELEAAAMKSYGFKGISPLAEAEMRSIVEARNEYK